MKTICIPIAMLIAISISGGILRGQDTGPPELLDGFVKRKVGQTSIQIRYGSPSAGDRTIWGETVPYGKDWIAGGGKTTTIQFDEHVQINGNGLPPGVYGIYVHPISREDWQIVFSGNPQASGDGFDRSNDVLRISVTPEEVEHRDRLKFGLQDVRYEKPFKSTLYLHWGRLKAGVSIHMTGRMPLAQGEPEIPGTAKAAWEVVHNALMLLAAEKIEAAVEDFAEDFETDFGDGGSTAAYVQLMNNLKRGGLLEEMEISFADLVVEMDENTAVFKNIGVRAPFGDSKLNYALERRDGRWLVVSIMSP